MKCNLGHELRQLVARAVLSPRFVLSHSRLLAEPMELWERGLWHGVVVCSARCFGVVSRF